MRRSQYKQEQYDNQYEEQKYETSVYETSTAYAAEETYAPYKYEDNKYENKYEDKSENKYENKYDDKKVYETVRLSASRLFAGLTFKFCRRSTNTRRTRPAPPSMSMKPNRPSTSMKPNRPSTSMRPSLRSTSMRPRQSTSRLAYSPAHPRPSRLKTRQELYETSTYEYQPEETYVYADETYTSEYAYPTYGSGASEYGSGYDDCVSRESTLLEALRKLLIYPPECVAKFGAPKADYTPNAYPTEGASGTVHTVLVAPEAGVLRYHPFALNATVGDTVRYVWTTPANHTATLSSELAICNKSALADERSFVSGIKNAEQGEQICEWSAL